MRSLLFLLSAVTAALAAPLEERATAPSASLQNGTVVGSTLNKVDSFKGIPFALPPTGTRRLAPPQTITATYPGGTHTATGVPTACPQFFFQVDSTDLPSDVLGELLMSPIVQAATVTGEDCLTMNVQRPAGTKSTDKLPVVFWIFGGGFELGSTQMYDGSMMVAESVALGHPVMYVSVNYRVGAFGFLAGKELQADGSTNLALKDQRLGLEWVQENIAAFGGDPDKVTIWGESAGSISVLDHMIINNGDNTYNGKAMFRGAIMNSGTIVPAEDVANAKPQALYDELVKDAGCSSASDTLACLRGLDYATFQRAANSAPGIFSYSSLNLAYVPRPDPADSFFSLSPEISIKNGAYTKIPVITGDQEDEGPLFSLVTNNIITTEQLVDYVAGIFPGTPRSVVAAAVATYPNNPSAGSPFRTGILNNIYPQFKRLAAIFGDIVFNLRRRQFLYAVSDTVPAWSYLDSHLHGTAVLGTFHGSDLLSYYFGLGGTTTKTYLDYYVSFINFLDPNAIGNNALLINWPQYNASKPTLVQLQSLSNNYLADNFRSKSFDFFQANFGDFRV